MKGKAKAKKWSCIAGLISPFSNGCDDSVRISPGW